MIDGDFKDDFGPKVQVSAVGDAVAIVFIGFLRTVH